MPDLPGVLRVFARAAGLCCALGLLLSPSAGAAQKPSGRGASGTPSFDELYARGRTINAGVTTLTARFTETTTPSLLTRPLVERGLLYVQRPSRRVALHYTDPPDRVTLIDGDRMITSWPSRKILERRDVGATQRRVQRYFEEGDASELRKGFDIEVRDRSERPGMREMGMSPKRKQIRENLARLDIWVDESSGFLNAMRMTFSNGDIKLMEFTDVVANGAIDPAVFSVPK
jgi:outer membrane lipoprotein-sorting protein